MRKPLLIVPPGENMFARQIIRTMKLTPLLLLFMCIQVTASTYAQSRITADLREVSVKRLLKEIEKQSNYRFVYNNSILPENKMVTVSVKDATLEETMKQTLRGTGLSYSVKEDGLIVIFNPGSAVQADIPVKGRVTDGQGNPLPGVSVKVEGLSIGTSTDIQGRYTLVVPEGANALEFGFIGFASQTVSLTGSGEVNIILREDNRTLEEVTVTGYTNYSRTQSANAASVVTSEKIGQVPMGSVDQILQGRVPGMTVIASSGQPGTSASVTIRGVNSISGSRAPLYVMDGIQIESSYFQTLNPDDIASVTVLKDASAKALYGSRGSNGVIVITTKKGKTGRVQVDYKSQYGQSDLTKPGFTMMNTEQRLRFEEEVGLEIGRNIGPGWVHSPKNPSYATKTPDQQRRSDQILDSLRSINTDWRDLFFQQSQFMEQQISASGGNENVRFYNSLNYYKQDGIAKRTGMERYNLRSNVDFSSGKFTGNVNLSLGYSSSSFTEGVESTSVGASMASVYYALPYEYPYAPDGTLIHPGNRTANILDQREGSQGLERLLNSSDKTDQFKTITGISLGYQITPELKLSTRTGVDYRNSTDQVYINPDSYYGSRSNSNTVGGRGKFGEGSRRNFSIMSTSGLTYSKKFNDVHDFEASAFLEYVYENYRSFNYNGYGLDARLPETPAGITVSTAFLPGIGGGRTSAALLSYMGVGRYTYNDKYTLTGSYRYDGSTRVAPQNRWHGFYSLGANWNAKAEEILKNVDFIPELRLRASYGSTASPFGGNFDYLPTYAVNTSYGGASALRPVAAGNENFDWEYVNEFNTGFDVALFKQGRLRIAADYYNKITTNMFIDQPPSITSGFEVLSLSSGKMRNRGIEADIQGEVIKTKDFSWNLGLNFAYNKNEILRLTDDLDEIPDGDTRIWKVGYPLGTYYAPNWAGVNPENGEAQYYDKEGNITTTYDFDALAVTESGSLFPKLTGGFNTGLQYKSFTASALFSFVSGVKRWNNEDLYNENDRYMTSNQSIRMLEDRWKKPGDIATLQRIDIRRQFSSKDIQDASFLRLRNVTLGYSVPANVIERLKFVKGVKVFVQGQNLFTWTKWRGLDPENNNVYGRFQYPAAKTYTAGLNVNF